MIKKLKPVRRSAQDRIAEILVAARLLMAEKGHENFVPGEVAIRCGVSEATIYKYFPTKRDLLLRAAESWFEDMLTRVPDVTIYPNIFERLREFVAHSLSIIRREPALTRYVLLELRSDPAYRSTNFHHLNRRFTAGIRDVITDAIASGEFRQNISPRLIRNMIFGSIEHQTWAYLRGQGDFSIEETANAIANIVYRGAANEGNSDRDKLDSALQQIEDDAMLLEERIATLRARIHGVSSFIGSNADLKTQNAPTNGKTSNDAP